MEDIRDIKGLVPLPHSWWWLWALLVVAAVAAALWLYLRRRSKTETVSAGPPPSPYAVAIQALRQLLDENLMGRGEVDAFYTRLSDIVRHYLEGRFGLRAPERTTEEFLYEIARDSALAPEHQALLGLFLQEADLVKFARFRPGLADMKRAFDAAERFVRETGTVLVGAASPPRPAVIDPPDRGRNAAPTFTTK
jgi:hypothetical protein